MCTAAERNDAGNWLNPRLRQTHGQVDRVLPDEADPWSGGRVLPPGAGPRVTAPVALHVWAAAGVMAPQLALSTQHMLAVPVQGRVVLPATCAAGAATQAIGVAKLQAESHTIMTSYRAYKAFPLFMGSALEWIGMSDCTHAVRYYSSKVQQHLRADKLVQSSAQGEHDQHCRVCVMWQACVTQQHSFRPHQVAPLTVGGAALRLLMLCRPTLPAHRDCHKKVPAPPTCSPAWHGCAHCACCLALRVVLDTL